ncbi:MAG: anthranilate synthase component I [Streptosporangiaceae bacterium]|jgi:anthranilate synthase
MDPTASHDSGFVTPAGVRVSRSATPFDPAELAWLTRQVDSRRGGVLSSGMEYPGRYSRWQFGYVDPCIEIVAHGRRIAAQALNERGLVLLPVIGAALHKAAGTAAAAGRPDAGPAPGPAAGSASTAASAGSVIVVIPEPAGTFTEEERSRRPTVFSALREILAAIAGPDSHLGLYGAFGYDLAFQFEPVRQRHRRPASQRDLVLHLPDELYVLDRKRETAIRYRYDFETDGRSTRGLPRRTAGTGGAGAMARAAGDAAGLPAAPEPGAYARVVEEARQRFACGDLFEVVPSHEFYGSCGSPAAFYERLRQRNPAPYEFFLNLGDGEYLVGASPEMYVRVTGDRVETCPIAGTVPRGDGPLEDAANIAALIGSAKEESELTMCTDVDRNDKSRICEPGSVKVIGRRQIEIYSRVIHTVDHVEGRLRPGFDALDAFLTHMWAVTVTGAPKTWAMQFIEEHEDAPRRWYGGAVGMIGVDGGMNTGLTLRTAHIRDGIAAVRTGATLLFDSDPAAEERETQIKARALLETLAEPESDAAPDQGKTTAERPSPAGPAASGPAALPGTGLRVLLVDHQDSFVHTLGGYFREQGAAVTTLRAGFGGAVLDTEAPDLVVLSPGPGRPSDFSCDRLLSELDARGISTFGVCLGLQAMVEHAGGELALLGEPVHGKTGLVRVLGGELLAGLPAEFAAGRYHSLYAVPGQVKGGLQVTAVTPDGAVMAIEDAAAGRWGVQFHPESILTAAGGAGHLIIANVLRLCRARAAGAVPAGTAPAT